MKNNARGGDGGGGDGERRLMTITQTEGYDKFKALAVATDISPPGSYPPPSLPLLLLPSAALG